MAALNDEMHERARHEYLPAFFMAMLPALQGRADEAFSYLERALAERDSVLITFKRWPANQEMTRRLQDDPRFADLLSRVGFPDDRPGNTVPKYGRLGTGADSRGAPRVLPWPLRCTRGKTYPYSTA